MRRTWGDPCAGQPQAPTVAVDAWKRQPVRASSAHATPPTLDNDAGGHRFEAKKKF